MSAAALLIAIGIIVFIVYSASYSTDWTEIFNEGNYNTSMFHILNTLHK